MPESSRCPATTLIQQLGLEPHPEGGWFREVHRSALQVKRLDGQTRSGLTLILFLLKREDISRWHRVVGADETWHHAGGAPLELWLLPPSGGMATSRLLGPVEGPNPASAAGNRGEVQPVLVVPAGWWQAARSLGEWTLLTCCVGPGFDFEDFELLRHSPQADHPPGALAELL